MSLVFGHAPLAIVTVKKWQIAAKAAVTTLITMESLVSFPIIIKHITYRAIIASKLNLTFLIFTDLLRFLNQLTVTTHDPRNLIPIHLMVFLRMTLFMIMHLVMASSTIKEFCAYMALEFAPPAVMLTALSIFNSLFNLIIFSFR